MEIVQRWIGRTFSLAFSNIFPEFCPSLSFGGSKLQMDF